MFNKKEYMKNWRKKNKEKIGEYRKKNKKWMKEYKKEHYQKNKEKIDLINKEWVRKNPEKRKEHINKYNNKDTTKIYKKEYYQKNKVKIIKKHSKYVENKKLNDKNFNLTRRLRVNFWIALKHYTKTGKIMSSKKYGIDYKAIIEYLKPFPKDLSNYHIHHIKPLFTFNFINPDGSTNLEEVRKAWKPENFKLVTIEEHKEIHRKLNKIK